MLFVFTIKLFLNVNVNKIFEASLQLEREKRKYNTEYSAELKSKHLRGHNVLKKLFYYSPERKMC